MEKGTIYSYSIVYSAAEAFKNKVPYVVAVIEDTQGKRLARIEGYTEKTKVAIGMEVNFLEVDEGGRSVYSF